MRRGFTGWFIRRGVRFPRTSKLPKNIGANLLIGWIGQIRWAGFLDRLYWR